MGNTLDSLKKLATTNTFNNPFEEDNECCTERVETKLPKIKSKKKKQNPDEDIIDRLNQRLDRLGALSGDDFDDLLDSINVNDEDTELKTTLVGMGRKYARNNAVSAEESEVTKAFAPQEAELRGLLVEVSKDCQKIEHDLEALRGTGYNRSAIKTAELVSAKNSIQSTKLNIIKTMNDIQKAKFDIKSKIDKGSAQNTDSYAANSVMQQIFGMGHESLLDSVGGRDESAGSGYNDHPDSEYDDNINGELLCERYDNEKEDSDGDRFLKYENQNVNVILEEDASGNRSVYAEDEEGNVLTDYPIPTDIESLTFEINHRTNVAIDQLQRSYTYRQI